jgi:hypothetical protein
MAAAAGAAGGESVPACKADFSELWMDECLSDFSLRVRVKTATSRAAAAVAAAGGQRGQQRQSEGEEAPEEEGAGVVATLPLHSVVLVQRSAYFDRMVRTEMRERKTKVMEFEFEDEQGETLGGGGWGE